jgi:hypothetical protein
MSIPILHTFSRCQCLPHRLVDVDRVVRENAELRDQQSEAAREAKWQAERDEVKVGR